MGREFIIIKIISLLTLFNAQIFAQNLTIEEMLSNQACGGYLVEKNGYLQTPNFPDKFSLPLSFRWLIHAGKNMKTNFYFTQFYMRRGLRITEFDEYDLLEDNQKGRRYVTEINFEKEVSKKLNPQRLAFFIVKLLKLWHFSHNLFDKMCIFSIKKLTQNLLLQINMFILFANNKK